MRLRLGHYTLTESSAWSGIEISVLGILRTFGKPKNFGRIYGPTPQCHFKTQEPFFRTAWGGEQPFINPYRDLRYLWQTSCKADCKYVEQIIYPARKSLRWHTRETNSFLPQPIEHVFPALRNKYWRYC